MVSLRPNPSVSHHEAESSGVMKNLRQVLYSALVLRLIFFLGEE